ncbi:MAG: DUF1573 domain-containing protein [Limnochordaceae bacterium]|nr:DUF1573 domain-containing protein [Limnochordaceae bacterium]
MSRPESSPLPALQEAVANNLIRHRSILDIISKLDETNAKVNRSVARSVTLCGCIQVHAEKQQLGESLHQCLECANSHVQGELCEECTEQLEQELGRHLYYLAALCNSLGVSLDQVVRQELERLSALGLFTLA